MLINICVHENLRAALLKNDARSNSLGFWGQRRVGEALP